MRVHIVTNISTLSYHDYCIESYTKLSAQPDKLEFVSYCLDGNSYVQLTTEGRKTVRLQDGSGSRAHAEGVNAALANMVTDDVNLIADSDTVMLMRGWDDELRDLCQLYGVVGTTYEDIGGHSSGDIPVQTYKRLPNVTWCAFSNRYEFNFDAMSNKEKDLPIDTQELSETFNLPIGRFLLREPAWRLPIYIREHNIPAYPLKFVRPTSGEAKAVLTGNDYHTEYQLKDGTPFVAHQRGSMSKLFRSHPLSVSFYNACEAYISKL